jgi:hypothetical protein
MRHIRCQLIARPCWLSNLGEIPHACISSSTISLPGFATNRSIRSRIGQHRQ